MNAYKLRTYLRLVLLYTLEFTLMASICKGGKRRKGGQRGHMREDDQPTELVGCDT